MTRGEAAALARERLDALAKPPGSLGRLEELAVLLASTQGSPRPASRPRRLLIFAGDHGVVAEGVGPWPQDVTAALMRLTLEGRSSAAVLARGAGTPLTLVNVGARANVAGEHPDLRNWRVAAGTRNLARQPAMSADQFAAALEAGARAARECVGAGERVIALGEIGIGNSTAASCLVALLTGAEAAEVVGPGAGSTGGHLRRKHEVVAEAVRRGREVLGRNPRGAMAGVAGYEIAAMAGCILEAARSGVTIVLDGFIAAAAALVARELRPDCLGAVVAAHRGAEPGHARALERLGLEPFLDWGMRLGEGTGALLLLPSLDAAAALLSEVAELHEVLNG